MKSLIVTVAGKATRFNRDTERETLKCLYTCGDDADTLLYQIIAKAEDYGQIVVVGGYLQAELDAFIARLPESMRSRITTIHNPHFADYGSAYSLYLGILALDKNCDCATFAEGDLYYDADSFRRIDCAAGSVFTVNHDLILASKAVVAYTDTEMRIRYLYDTAHKDLEIPGAFTAIYNSAQIWKFADVELLRRVNKSLSDKELRGTNLEIVQRYFDALSPREYEMIDVPVWYNCNTVADYNKVYSEIKHEDNQR